MAIATTVTTTTVPGEFETQELAEVLRQVDEQKATVTSYHSRAASILAATGVILSVTAASLGLDERPSAWQVIVLAALVSATVVTLLATMYPRRWRFEIDRDRWALAQSNPAESAQQFVTRETRGFLDENDVRMSQLSWCYTLGVLSFGLSILWLLFTVVFRVMA
jgi:hypothetical protein